MPTAQDGSLDIALVYDCVFPGSVGGVERRNAELARALADRGHRVTLAGWNRDGEEVRCGGAVRVLPLGRPAPLYGRSGRRRPGAALRFAFHCLRLRVGRYDVVETAHLPFLHVFVLAAKCALARRPLVVSWYELWGRYWRLYQGPLLWRAFAGVEWATARLGALATASSELTRERLRAYRRGDPPRILPCGIDLVRMDAVLDSARREPDRAPAPPLLYAGRLLREKRLDLLLEALAHLAPAGAVRGRLLRIVGDGPERARLETLARELGVEERVEFVGRLASGDEVFAALAEARIAVQPSSREGFGLFALEAMAAGLPVVYCASPENALAELVRDGVEGVRTEPDAVALAAALAELLDPETADRLRRLGRAGRVRAEAHSWEVIAARAEALFAEAAERSGGVR